MKTRFLFGVTCAMLLAAGPAGVLGGGNPLMQARLFQAYPEARLAHAASLDARQKGLLKTPAFAKGSGKSQREWFLDYARETVQAFATHLREAAGSRSIDATVAILLVSDVYRAEVPSLGDDVSLAPFAVGGTREYFDIYTTTIALRALVEGRLTWQDAVDLRLVVLGDAIPAQRRVGVTDREDAHGAPHPLPQAAAGGFRWESRERQRGQPAPTPGSRRGRG